MYARDLAIGAVSKLQDVIWSVYRGEFVPDAPRSGYRGSASTHEHCSVAEHDAVVKVEDEPCDEASLGCNEPEEAAAEEDACSGSSDDSESAEGSSSGEEAVAPPPKKCFRHFAAGPLEGKFVMHKVSHLVHYIDASTAAGKNTNVISCGKTLNQNYKSVAEFETMALCRRCKTNAVKDGYLPKNVA